MPRLTELLTPSRYSHARRGLVRTGPASGLTLLALLAGLTASGCSDAVSTGVGSSGALVSAPAQATASPTTQRVSIVGGPCEGCEAVFEHQPAVMPIGTGQLAPPGEPGSPLLLGGAVRDGDGAPVAGVIVYAYQTDDAGMYPRDAALTGAAARHGRLRGFVATDAAGRFALRTVRPGGYPGTDLPAHVHLHVIEPGRCTYYLDDVVFTDDPRLTPVARVAHTHGRGGPGVSTPTRQPDGTWLVTRDIVLGAGISDFARCSAPPR